MSVFRKPARICRLRKRRTKRLSTGQLSILVPLPSVNFNQPHSSSIALNRVLSATPSTINGKLTSNGQVWVINPSGVVFGAGAAVNVGGLVASTMDIADDDFLAGKAQFKRGSSTGAVVNKGSITAADGGLIALLAPEVCNEGIITARLGTVVLAAGEKVVLSLDSSDGLVTVQVDPAQVKTLVENKLMIVAGKRPCCSFG